MADILGNSLGGPGGIGGRQEESTNVSVSQLRLHGKQISPTADNE